MSLELGDARSLLHMVLIQVSEQPRLERKVSIAVWALHRIGSYLGLFWELYI